MPQRSQKSITSTPDKSVAAWTNRASRPWTFPHASHGGPHAFHPGCPRKKSGQKVISQAWNRTPDLPRPGLTDIFDCRPTSPPVMYAHELKYILNTYGPYHLGFPILAKGLNTVDRLFKYMKYSLYLRTFQIQ